MGIDFRRPRHIRGFRFGEVLVWDFTSRPLVEKTVSGSIVAFSDGADAVKLKSCAVTIAPTLDGVSSVDVVQTGKNLVSNSASAWESGTINSSGNNASGSGTRTIGYFDIKGGLNYKISGVIAPETASDFRIFFYDKNKDFITYRNYNSTPTIPENACYFRVRNISIADISSLQIEYGDTATTYEPYIAPTTHTANLGRTIYGGSVDVVNGEGVDNCTRIQIKDRAWTREASADFFVFVTTGITAKALNYNFECEGYTNAQTYRSNLADKQIGTYNNTGGRNRFAIRDDSYTTSEDFITAKGDNYIVFENTTPEDFTFTPVPIISRLGDNTMWSEQGDIEVTYYANAN